MAYLISIGSTVCGTTAIMANSGNLIKMKPYAIANITFLEYFYVDFPYNLYFNNEP